MPQSKEIIMAMAALKTQLEAPPYASESSRWLAVTRRDKRADGAFYYSVKSTGVYCRPSCASRLARRENVRFHASRADAERAGFRPCKRCRPDAAVPEARNAALVAEACRAIAQAGPDNAPDLEALAKAAGMSRFHFHRLFKSVAGITPRAYAASLRADRLRRGLSQSRSVTEAFYDAGFNSSGRFYAQAGDILGMAPREFRAGGKGAAIRFAIGRCSLGAILVAATAKGVCAVSLGDDPDKLAREFQDRFANAALAGDDRDFAKLVAGAVGLVETPGTGSDLPLDLRGTAFQLRVWQELRRIKLGKTASYGEIARRIGKPKAVRAVARACAANAVAVAIPCHRVVRKNGDPGGYRWGVERKRALLARERG
ncbi:MAG TPA: bifunctional DNA-binding transcriptional regulator/O6-methylguanine-DNA methyltransferase Ada [Stellaceae bacterium]|nr:bifunctional DNA-binding transcriptional regulator/O6-methylguanine-DNA methyltransferase Ada [Stellaceae bacterium]